MDTLVRELTVEEAESLCADVEQALETGDLGQIDLPMPSYEDRQDLMERVEIFHGQCQFLADRGMDKHPCVWIGAEGIPIEFALTGDIEQAVDFTAGDREERLGRFLSQQARTQVDLVDIGQVKKTFSKKLVEFVKAGVEWAGLTDRGGGGGGSGEDRYFGGESRGMDVTVNANTLGLQVVYSETFMLRSENAFGEALTSPVIGSITKAGPYYFGTADNRETNWARFTFKIPPMRTINLMH